MSCCITKAEDKRPTITYRKQKGKYVVCRDGDTYLALSPDQVDELGDVCDEIRDTVEWQTRNV